MTTMEYDEFAFLTDNAQELGLGDAVTIPPVRRISATVNDGQTVSAIQWADGTPSLVLLHGGGQNAHTWDSVLVALGEPALAVDLPGHGHSDWREDRNYTAQENARAVAPLIREIAQTPVFLVGMSMGGLTAISLTAQFPDLVRSLLVVDVTPNSALRNTEMTQSQRGTVALTAGPKTYDSYDAMVEATAAAAPHRSLSNVRRGVLHNAREQEDGRWAWRYDNLSSAHTTADSYTNGWDEVSAIGVPVTLVRGGDSHFVSDDDVAELLSRQPQARVEVVEGAGHSVQSDQPLRLVEHLRDFLAAPSS